MPDELTKALEQFTRFLAWTNIESKTHFGAIILDNQTLEAYHGGKCEKAIGFAVFAAP